VQKIIKSKISNFLLRTKKVGVRVIKKLLEATSHTLISKDEIVQGLFQNQELTNQNQELTNQNQELTNQNQELTNQNQELTNQNRELGRYKISSFCSEVQKRLLELVPENSLLPMAHAMKNSKSQLSQDVMAVALSSFAKTGFFVEIGACDGQLYSNTHMLEKEFGWRGIVAEPGITWHEDLKKFRSCSIDLRAVSSVSGDKVLFTETMDATLSSFGRLLNLDHMAEFRLPKCTYEVETISLNDLLNLNNAPNSIDYLSLDTEGSEFDILSTFNFDEYSFTLITVEHNYTRNEKLINELLELNGYVRIFRDESLFDAWYVKKSISSFFLDIDFTVIE
jgi:FkbM family methyltransferase